MPSALPSPFEQCPADKGSSDIKQTSHDHHRKDIKPHKNHLVILEDASEEKDALEHHDGEGLVDQNSNATSATRLSSAQTMIRSIPSSPPLHLSLNTAKPTSSITATNSSPTRKYLHSTNIIIC